MCGNTLPKINILKNFAMALNFFNQDKRFLNAIQSGADLPSATGITYNKQYGFYQDQYGNYVDPTSQIGALYGLAHSREISALQAQYAGNYSNYLNSSSKQLSDQLDAYTENGLNPNLMLGSNAGASGSQGMTTASDYSGLGSALNLAGSAMNLATNTVPNTFIRIGDAIRKKTTDRLTQAGLRIKNHIDALGIPEKEVASALWRAFADKKGIEFHSGWHNQNSTGEYVGDVSSDGSSFGSFFADWLTQKDSENHADSMSAQLREYIAHYSLELEKYFQSDDNKTGRDERFGRDIYNKNFAGWANLLGEMNAKWYAQQSAANGGKPYEIASDSKNQILSEIMGSDMQDWQKTVCLVLVELACTAGNAVVSKGLSTITSPLP